MFYHFFIIFLLVCNLVVLDGIDFMFIDQNESEIREILKTCPSKRSKKNLKNSSIQTRQTLIFAGSYEYVEEDNVRQVKQLQKFCDDLLSGHFVSVAIDSNQSEMQTNEINNGLTLNNRTGKLQS